MKTITIDINPALEELAKKADKSVLETIKHALAAYDAYLDGELVEKEKQ